MCNSVGKKRKCHFSPICADGPKPGTPLKMTPKRVQKGSKNDPQKNPKKTEFFEKNVIFNDPKFHNFYNFNKNFYNFNKYFIKKYKKIQKIMQKIIKKWPSKKTPKMAQKCLFFKTPKMAQNWHFFQILMFLNSISS